MKQVLQDLQGGRTVVEDVPAPRCRDRHLQIATTVSVISAGTERMLVDFARGSLVSKALQQPERVRDALQKVRTDGIFSTVEAIRSKLDQPATLGYCNVGKIISVGDGIAGFKVGDRVVSNGKHAEVVVVPWTLCAQIPDGVDDDNAAFAVLGAIALQGMRLAAPTLGEAFVVTGLGLVGLLAVQMLRANGCRVLGIDSDPTRLDLARQFGAETVDLSIGEDPLSKAASFSRGRGVDGVLLTLSATSSEPLSQAAKMCRKRGRIVLIGITGLELDRADFYEKEVSFQVSCSYGPGRYDRDYEDAGRDYPVGFVRWTEQRNFEAVLDMMASGQVDARPLISHRFAINEAAKGYDTLSSREHSLGILLDYPQHATFDIPPARVELSAKPIASGKVVTGFIGAGNYGGRVLIKSFSAAGAALHTISSQSGVTAVHQGRKSGFRFVSTDSHQVLEDHEINVICIATRHDSHARYVTDALKLGKHVFVEKPLCLTLEELAGIDDELSRSDRAGALLMVGFNRRFAPMVVKIKELLSTVTEPKVFIMTVNAGAIPSDHWTQDAAVGGGRIVGEACHFIDLLRHLAGASIRGFDVAAFPTGGGMIRSDVASITLHFADGSFGVINYLANGHKAYPKERLEIFCAGRVLVLDNFRSLTGYGWPSFSSQKSWTQDKGQVACVAAFVSAVKNGGYSPIPVNEILEVSRVAIEAAELAH